jgi:ethanolamine permease
MCNYFYSNCVLIFLFAIIGGTYGFARVTVNIYGGYIIGCCESVEYIFYVALATRELGSAGLILVLGGKVMWTVNKALGITALLVVIIFCLCTIPFMELEEHAKLGAEDRLSEGNPWFSDRPVLSVLRVLPLVSWLYIGIEATPLAGQAISEVTTTKSHQCCYIDLSRLMLFLSLLLMQPRKTIPKGIMRGIGTLVITALSVVFCVAAVGPRLSDVIDSNNLLNVGFSRALGLTLEQVTWLSFPAVYATAFGFMYVCTRQVYAMSDSYLLPAALSQALTSTGEPYLAVIVVSCLCFVSQFACRHSDHIANAFFGVCVMSSYITYMSSFASFIAFRLFYHELVVNSSSRSPLGLTGAIIGMLIFLLCFASAVGLQETSVLSITIFLGIIAVSTVYYFVFSIHTQRFSDQEKATMLVAHVIKGTSIRRPTRISTIMHLFI